MAGEQKRASGSKKTRKYNRNREKCKKYAAQMTRTKNKESRALRILAGFSGRLKVNPPRLTMEEKVAKYGNAAR